MKRLMLVLMIVAIGFALTACERDEKTEETEDIGHLYFLSIDLNPSIDWLIDEDDEIVAYFLNNDDAEIVLGDEDFIGMDFEDAIDFWVGALYEVGFLDEDIISVFFIAGSLEVYDRAISRFNSRLIDRNLPVVLEELQPFNSELLDHHERERIETILDEVEPRPDPSIPRFVFPIMEDTWDEEVFRNYVVKDIDELLEQVKPVMEERIRAFNTERIQENVRIREELKQMADDRRAQRDDDRADMTPGERPPFGREDFNPEDVLQDIADELLDRFITERLRRRAAIDEAIDNLDEE